MEAKKIDVLERAKYGIRSNVVERNTVISSNSKVAPVDPVVPVENYTFVTYNFLTASDEFYDKLKNLKKEYESFYHEQQELEQAIKNLEYDESLVENMETLVKKYNTAIEALKVFDHDFGTDYFTEIVSIVDDFKIELFRVGIIVGVNSNLIYDKEKFKEKLLKFGDTFKFIFDPARGLIIRLYRAFRSIKVPNFEEELESKYGNHLGYEGMLMDKKG